MYFMHDFCGYVVLSTWKQHFLSTSQDGMPTQKSCNSFNGRILWKMTYCLCILWWHVECRWRCWCTDAAVEARIRIGWVVRGRLYSSCVQSSMLHGSETRPVRKKIVPKWDWGHLLTLTLTSDDLESHIIVNVSLTSNIIPSFITIRQSWFFGQLWSHVTRQIARKSKIRPERF